MDTNNIDVVRAIVKAARPSDAKRAPPRKPRKPPPALQRAAALVQGVDACESALKRCARAYAMPDDDAAMTDAARDAVDARVRALLRECQAALEEPSSDNGKPGSREAHARGGVEVARARTAALAALFRDLEVLRRRREAAASAPLAIRAAVDADAALRTSNEDAELRAMRGRRIVVVEPPKPKPRPVAAKPAATPRPAPPRAQVPANQLQREQAQLEAEFESLSDAARTVEARTEDVSRLAAQFATLVDEQHDQVVTLDGLVGDTANQVDKAGDHVAQAASRRATLPRVFNAVVLSLAALLLLIHAVHS